MSLLQSLTLRVGSQVTGGLPVEWSALRRLSSFVIDRGGTAGGLAGPLPPEYSTLSLMQTFR